MSSVVPTQVLPQNPPKSYWQKGWDKCKQQPLVPIGALATCVAFIGATRQLRTGDKKQFNRFLRFRVLAQGATIAACLVGSVMYSGQAALEKAKLREEELEKIRLAGTRRQGNAPGDDALSAADPIAPVNAGPATVASTPAAASVPASLSPPSPSAPASPEAVSSPSGATESVWNKWGFGRSSK